ncbi:MAG TPA: hypothetical protein VD928_02815 [Candidatus Paceibacterota bacterium]|nr:hypothetical protein [Candidatus Paceibacterota bacterium]
MPKILKRWQRHKYSREGLYGFGTLALLAIFTIPTFVAGSSTCTFTTVGTTMTLNSDCTTDETILIPQGFTLDGAGNTITAVDPPGGHFKGAIVKNAGTEAHVIDLTVTTSNLANVCDGGNDRLRGIMFEGATGTIINASAIDINQGASGCQEGNGIEVRNAPFDTSGSDLKVRIVRSVAMNYQKTGIIANGSVAVEILDNIVVGAGPVNYIAQNGIQVGFGGTAVIQDNAIRGNDYTPKDTISCGVLMFAADGVRANQNKYGKNEINFCNFGERGGGQFNPSEE